MDGWKGEWIERQEDRKIDRERERKIERERY
jgi:hypothetical protein